MSAVPEVSFMEMARHCEALVAGKREMSHLISLHRQQESLAGTTSKNWDEEYKQMASYAVVLSSIPISLLSHALDMYVHIYYVSIIL